ncbi:PQQ-dependent sugar dehydrogenase [bacterium]|nr:PQQ-dependent sugar dehydrogenase [bacterium]
MLRLKTLLAASMCCVAGWVSAQPYGIDTRVENTSLLIDSLPNDNPGTMQLVEAFPDLSFTYSVLLVEAPDGSGRLFHVSQGGVISVFNKSGNPTSTTPFLDIADRVRNSGEEGLLGLAFDPDYATTGEFYVYYSWNGSYPGTSRVSRFTNDDPTDNSVDPSTEEILLSVPQPATNHNGGMLVFGPDDMLYVSLGDGGGGGDTYNNGQDPTTLLGTILRIDVLGTPDAGKPYAIPPDNPFYAGAGPAGAREEIFAYGLRNPFRMSFDPVTGLLYAGDVGQGAWEEIDIIESGANCGWNIMEGTHCYPPSTTTCDQTGLTLPIAEYPHADGDLSVTGGYVYYGTDVPDLYGTYIYADYGSGRIFGLKYDGENVTAGPYTLVENSGITPTAFGQGSDGEVYVLDYFGKIYVLRPATPGGTTDFPTKLSDMPALLAVGSGEDLTTSGIIAYEPSTRLWSDNAEKERYFAMPGLEQMGYQQYRGWDFPEQSILVKNFLLSLDERDPAGTLQRIETRLLIRNGGAWHGFSYEWNEAETDATLLTGSKSRPFMITDKNGDSFAYSWEYPNRNQCLQCHTDAANGALGLNTPQMNWNFEFPNSGIVDNQLRTYDHISLFTEALPDDPANLPAMPRAKGTEGTLQDRARAYLAANCSMCHIPGGTAPTVLDLRWEITNAEMAAIDMVPDRGDLGITDARIIASGDPDRSVLVERMETLDSMNRMPPLGTSRVDEEGVQLIRDWIATLEPPAGAADTWMMY